MTAAFEGSALRRSDDDQRRAAVDYARQLGRRLRQLRKQRGLTQRDLAARLGVSTPALCRWERGQASPKKSNFQAFADMFGLSEAELLSSITAHTLTNPASIPHELDPSTPFEDIPAIQRESLSDLLSTCKQKIADAAGTSPELVKIVIEV